LAHKLFTLDENDNVEDEKPVGDPLDDEGSDEEDQYPAGQGQMMPPPGNPQQGGQTSDSTQGLEQDPSKVDFPVHGSDGGAVMGPNGQLIQPTSSPLEHQKIVQKMIETELFACQQIGNWLFDPNLRQYYWQTGQYDPIYWLNYGWRPYWWQAPYFAGALLGFPGFLPVGPSPYWCSTWGLYGRGCCSRYGGLYGRYGRRGFRGTYGRRVYGGRYGGRGRYGGGRVHVGGGGHYGGGHVGGGGHYGGGGHGGGGHGGGGHGGGGGGGCFSSQSIVEVQGRGKVAITSVVSGDFVRSIEKGKECWSEVYNVEIRSALKQKVFAIEHDGSDDVLRLTEKHLVRANKDKQFKTLKPVQAQHVKVGMFVYAVDKKRCC